MSDRIPADEYQIDLRTAAGGNYDPRTIQAVFHNPGDARRGAHQTFNAPFDTFLLDNSRYVIAFSETSPGHWSCGTVDTPHIDSDSLPGWAMHGEISIYGNGFASGRTHRIPDARCTLALYGRPVNLDLPYLESLTLSSTPPNGYSYETGDTISFTAQFSEPVAGELSLPIIIGTGSPTLTAMADNSDTATFEYTVTDTDQDNRGFRVGRDGISGNVPAILTNRNIPASLTQTVNAVPYITRVHIVSRPSSPPWYTTGDTFQINVDFSQPISVTGDPTFQISVSGDRFMNYDAALSDADTMAFTYTFQTTDNDPDGVWIGNDRIRLHSDDAIQDSYRDAGTNINATITHGRIGGQGVQPNHRVSPLARIASVAITSDPQRGTNSDTYGADDVIQITATFNQDVTVAGDPEFRFSVSGDRDAAYNAAASSGDTVVFEYTVVGTDSDANGIWLGRHGGANTSFIVDSDDTIQNAAAVDAVLNFSLGRTCSGHKVDGTISGGTGRSINTEPAPNPPVKASPPDIITDTVISQPENSTAAYQMTATDQDTAQTDLTWSITGGADRNLFSITTGGSLSFVAAQDFENPGDSHANRSYEVTVNVSDGNLNDSIDLVVILTNVNEAPTANAGVDQSDVTAGSAVNLNGAGSDPDENDTLTYTWTQTSGPDIALSSNTIADPTFTAPTSTEALSLTFRLTVTDRGDLFSTDDVTVSVLAVTPPLTATISNAHTNHDGSARFTFHLTLSEAPVADFSYKTLHQHAFTVTNGTVSKARRLEPPGNVRWEITVTPAGNAAVTVTLPSTANCDDQGAICSDDGRRFTGPLTLTDDGPGS